jgi:hypothetical protein
MWRLAAATVLLPVALHAQGIPRAEYLHYVPLEPPRLTREAPASAYFHLFGDAAAADYRDVHPRDGIDDRRHAVLQAIAQRFAPFLVQNTASMPLDFKRFWRTHPAFPMQIDTWDLAAGRQLIASESIDMNTLGTWACQGEASAAPYGEPDTDDCRLVALLEAFDPYAPSALLSRVTATPTNRDQVTVMYFDMPGDDEASWKAAWVNPSTDRLRKEYQGLTRVYVHPFIHEYLGEDGEPAGYDVVLQYWFYYPINDGGNNHEGDWEHINVVVAPRGRVTQPLDEDGARRILAGEGLHDRATDDQLVIRRVEYYLHHKLMVLDYATPNVYRDREMWEAEADALLAEKVTEDWLWRRIRHVAYQDDDETLVNTHPIVYIGGDNKGIDQLIASPGGSNQDSHASYPFPGLYKDIGPGGSGEAVGHPFDHRRWYATRAQSGPDENAFRGGAVMLYDRPDLVEVVPDWERVLPLVRTVPEARREWAWLVLPVRWGYPASPSPMAGLIEHADMGNVGPIGPAYNAGWNRAGTGSGFSHYEPHVLPGLFPADPQDAFGNSLGFLNVIPLIGNLPPLDFLWRALALPVRAAAGNQPPLFYPSETVPERFLGIAGGMSWEGISQDIAAAVFHTPEEYRTGTPPLSPQLIEITLDLIALDTGIAGGGGLSESFADAAWAVQAQVAFYLGPRFVSTTGFRHVGHDAGFRIGVNTRPEPYEFRSRINMWDITGSVRYNLATSALKPYVKGGYGVNWYRLEDMTSDGEPLTEPTGPWIVNAWPLTWQYGAGFEFMLVHRFAPVPRGFDLGVQAEWLWFNGPTGIEYPDVLSLAAVRDAPTRMVRGALNLTLTLSF